jgi:MFS family permease
MVTMLKLIRNNHGFMVERILLIFLIIIALTVGISQYQKHGIPGFILGFLITIAGVVTAVFVLFGALDRIGYLHDKLHGKAWHKNTLKISGLILIFLFLSLWSMALMGIATLRFEALKKIPEPVFLAIALFAGAATTAISWFLKSAFWHYFWRLCGFLGISIAGAFFGMVIGQIFFTSLDSQMRAVDIAFIIPLIVYLFMLFTGKFKAKANEAATEMSKEE